MERLKKLFKEVQQEVRSIGIPISRNVYGPVVNTRTRARLGCCRAEKKPLAQTTYTIEISATVLDAPDHDIKEIIAHELLHTCRDCMNHGKKWKEYAALLERAYGYKITRTRSYESLGLKAPEQRETDYRYRLVCTGCGAEILRKRRCKVVENPGSYRCGKCGGTLKISTKNTTSCR